MNMPEADFMFEFKKFLDNHVDIRFQEHERDNDSTTDDYSSSLESRIDDIESQATDHEDRIDMLDGYTESFEAYEDRILALETKLSQLDDINHILERKIQQLLQMGRIKLYLASAAPTE